jgi:hypothetical protein
VTEYLIQFYRKTLDRLEWVARDAQQVIAWPLLGSPSCQPRRKEVLLPFSFRQFVRQTPSPTLKTFFDSRGIDFGDEVDWSKDDVIIARQVGNALERLPAEQAAPLISDFERAQTLSDERGYCALINAAPDRAAMLARFEGAENNQERALLVLLREPEIFQRAEDIRFFDYRIEGNYGRRSRCRPGASVRRDAQNLDSFGRDVSAFHRRRDGSGRNHFVEVIDRNADGTTQVTIYVEGLASNSIEFGERGLWRRPSRPAIEAALVYCSKTGTLETVAKGGKPVHERLRTAFAQHVLDVEPSFDLIVPQKFRLSKLATMPFLPTDPADGIEVARVRRLKLLPPNNGVGTLVVDAPADQAAVSAPGLSNAWFALQDPLRRGFSIVEGTISFHFHPVNGRSSRAIHLELGRDGSSNLKNLKQDDRAVAEKHILLWELVK